MMIVKPDLPLFEGDEGSVRTDKTSVTIVHKSVDVIIPRS